MWSAKAKKGSITSGDAAASKNKKGSITSAAAKEPPTAETAPVAPEAQQQQQQKQEVKQKEQQKAQQPAERSTQHKKEQPQEQDEHAPAPNLKEEKEEKEQKHEEEQKPSASSFTAQNTQPTAAGAGEATPGNSGESKKSAQASTTTTTAASKAETFAHFSERIQTSFVAKSLSVVPHTWRMIKQGVPLPTTVAAVGVRGVPTAVAVAQPTARFFIQCPDKSVYSAPLAYKLIDDVFEAMDRCGILTEPIQYAQFAKKGIYLSQAIFEVADARVASRIHAQLAGIGYNIAFTTSSEMLSAMPPVWATASVTELHVLANGGKGATASDIKNLFSVASAASRNGAGDADDDEDDADAATAALSVIPGFDNGLFYVSFRDCATAYSFLRNPVYSGTVQRQLLHKFGLFVVLLPTTSDETLTQKPQPTQPMQQQQQQQQHPTTQQQQSYRRGSFGYHQQHHHSQYQQQQHQHYPPRSTDGDADSHAGLLHRPPNASTNAPSTPAVDDEADLSLFQDDSVQGDSNSSNLLLLQPTSALAAATATQQDATATGGGMGGGGALLSFQQHSTTTATAGAATGVSDRVVPSLSVNDDFSGTNLLGMNTSGVLHTPEAIAQQQKQQQQQQQRQQQQRQQAPLLQPTQRQQPQFGAVDVLRQQPQFGAVDVLRQQPQFGAVDVLRELAEAPTPKEQAHVCAVRKQFVLRLVGEQRARFAKLLTTELVAHLLDERSSGCGILVAYADTSELSGIVRHQVANFFMVSSATPLLVHYFCRHVTNFDERAQELFNALGTYLTTEMVGSFLTNEEQDDSPTSSSSSSVSSVGKAVLHNIKIVLSGLCGDQQKNLRENWILPSLWTAVVAQCAKEEKRTSEKQQQDQQAPATASKVDDVSACEPSFAFQFLAELLVSGVVPLSQLTETCVNVAARLLRVSDYVCRWLTTEARSHRDRETYGTLLTLLTQTDEGKKILQTEPTLLPPRLLRLLTFALAQIVSEHRTAFDQAAAGNTGMMQLSKRYLATVVATDEALLQPPPPKAINAQNQQAGSTASARDNNDNNKRSFFFPKFDTYPPVGHPFPPLSQTSTGLKIYLSTRFGTYTFKASSGGGGGSSSNNSEAKVFAHPETHKEYFATPQAFFYFLEMSRTQIIEHVMKAAQQRGEALDRAVTERSFDRWIADQCVRDHAFDNAVLRIGRVEYVTRSRRDNNHNNTSASSSGLLGCGPSAVGEGGANEGTTRGGHRQKLGAWRDEVSTYPAKGFPFPTRGTFKIHGSVSHGLYYFEDLENKSQSYLHPTTRREYYCSPQAFVIMQGIDLREFAKAYDLRIDDARAWFNDQRVRNREIDQALMDELDVRYKSDSKRSRGKRRDDERR